MGREAQNDYMKRPMDAVEASPGAFPCFAGGQSAEPTEPRGTSICAGAVRVSILRCTCRTSSDSPSRRCLKRIGGMCSQRRRK